MKSKKITIRVVPSTQAKKHRGIDQVMADIVSLRTRLDIASDRKDNRVLACAIDGRSDYLVTGDRGLLILEAYEQVQIVTPRTFLDLLQSQ